MEGRHEEVCYSLKVFLILVHEALHIPQTLDQILVFHLIKLHVVGQLGLQPEVVGSDALTPRLGAKHHCTISSRTLET